MLRFYQKHTLAFPESRSFTPKDKFKTIANDAKF